MITKWTSHLADPKEKENFEKEVRSSRLVLERLTQIVDDLDNEQERLELNPKFYELPNWEYRQANTNGFRRAMSVMKMITNLDQQKENINDPRRPI